MPPMENATPTSAYTHASSSQTASTVHVQSTPTASNTHTQSHTNEINRLRVIHPNETVGAAPVCPPERPRSGVSIINTHASCAREFNDGCALVGRHGRAHRHRPYPSPSNHTWCALTHCTFDGSKPCGVPSPHRGYTFDSAGLASATQPTLGNNVSEGATHNVGCTFFRHTLTMLPTTHSGGGNASRTPAPSTLNEFRFRIIYKT